MAVIKNGLWVFVVAAILLSATYWNPFASRDEASNAGGTPNSQGWDARRYQGARVEEHPEGAVAPAQPRRHARADESNPLPPQGQ